MALASTPALADPGPLASYLRARTASDAAEAARGYDQALAASPADPLVAIRAYRGALLAGDLPLAHRAAAVLDQAGAPTDDQPLLPLAQAAAENDPRAFDAALARLRAGKLAMLAPSLAAWGAWARKGDWEAALAPDKADPAARPLIAETRALLLIASGRAADGVAALRALGGWSEAGLARAAGAELLLRAGERDLALSVVPAEGRARLATPGRDMSDPSLGFGTSRLLTRVAAEFTLGDAAPLGVSLARAALVADPTNDVARLLLTAALKEQREHDAALRVLDGVPPESALRPDADAARVRTLAAAGRRPEALAEAARLAARPGAGRDAWQLHADLLTDSGRPGDAVPLYRRIAAGEGAGEAAVWMQLGEALERSGDWPAARAALTRAVAVAPDDPLALNYLGYARVTRGEAKRESTAMLERAARLAPDSAAIADSLGWAYHLTGDTRRALPLLERAAAGEPADAEVAEHLGDAYWALGRRYEARYAWTAAAQAADGKERARLTGKAERGG